jgi:predicted nucleotidyltransferase
LNSSPFPRFLPFKTLVANTLKMGIIPLRTKRGVVSTMALQISVPREAIEVFCTRWRIRELAIFGSALRDDFRPDSDIDVLVDFEPGAHWGFMHLLEMTRELERIFGRPVDLVDKRVLEQDRNYIRRNHILRHRERVYGA